jgi:cytochrome c553
MLSTALLLFALSPVAHADAASDFATQCSVCHGAAGAGDGAGAAGLPVKPASFADPEFWKTRDDATVKKVIKEGGPAVGKSPLMAPLGASWSDEQLTAMVAYLKTLAPSE